MTIDAIRFHELLSEFKLEMLFNELGWERASLKPHTTIANGEQFTLTQIAHKRGVAVFVCSPDRLGDIPSRPVLLKIEKEAVKLAHEHLLVFSDAANTTLTWLWVSRAPGQPSTTRTHTWHKGQSGDSLRQKLSQIVWSLEEEEAITLTDVITGLRSAFDRDRISKSFYDRFKAQHDAFADFIQGLANVSDKAWYASLMLNRLMFVYFIQNKGFLDGNNNYLKDRLAQVQHSSGKGNFHSFYRHFLRRLFHEGLGQARSERNAELLRLIGDVPYLNGGLFSIHELEEANPDIDVPDEAFQELFKFFDAWDWHLDDRPLSSGKEINPDVLGYIFEKYINQKQMGAYYTKEDITEYISKNTVIPHLLKQAKERCKVAFDGETSVWNLLKTDPNRYIYPAMKVGVIGADGLIIPDSSLPDFVKAGLHNSQNRIFDRRYNLGDAQSPNHSSMIETLPTETWREYVNRRNYCLILREKLAKGEVTSINDLITLNLDIRQFIQDIIATCTSPDLLRAIWQAIVGRPPEYPDTKIYHGITILDPTCGSGAFLFAALNVLEPLYEACLDRMEGFIEDASTLDKPSQPDFLKVLAEVEKHPSRSYYIYKTIILHNLFGVDIMAEAVEICKLRLFLKLVSQVEAGGEIEPLPDIDFNIRAGNTLVGYATEAQFEAAKSLASDQTHRDKIKASTADLADLFNQFRGRQTVHGGKVTATDKYYLRDKLSELSLELDKYLARDVGVNPDDSGAFSSWRESHQPFHWFSEFYGVMQDGGFDVIIGNPPYVVNSPQKVLYDLSQSGLNTLSSKNLYSYVFERSVHIAKKEAPISLIVQLTAISSKRMQSLQELLINRGLLLVLPYPRRPESMFDGVEMPVVILSTYPQKEKSLVTTRVGRMYGLERAQCLQTHSTVRHSIQLHGHRIGKLHTEIEKSILSKISATKFSTRQLVAPGGDHVVFYQEACRYWLKAQAGLPYFARNGVSMQPPHGRVFSARSLSAAGFWGCLLNSSLFYWYYSLFSDCEHVNDDLVKSVPIPSNWDNNDWATLSENLNSQLVKYALRKTINTKQGHVIEYDEMKASRAKSAIDEIDLALGKLYGLSEDEIDFIINYDIKYRMGSSTDEE
ncbi:Eco57I restriction-modification methylase domain-containing protein [Pseudomonas sp. SXM-1]|uniref:Eco57I restriction-modification methylase domain-containing protein n=1 Tax=Pseudomonas sp. SXM-1 TaxID=2169583 RepID=UPI00106748CB|nr:Eco57I restriction-modification methylase domain-containing protein [Pseudomonas sp. SXM-1]QBQ08938.1 SAM-dependent methyltransferase [Pseudomonas sp. SXM-1]